MRGRDWSTRPLSAETLREAQQSFAQALQIDPRSIDAKLGIAGILNAKYINGFSDSPQQDKATAEKLLHEVLDRDPDRADAHAGMGIVLRLRGQLTESKSELETALQLDPNNVTAHRQLGFTLFFLGQPAAAIVEGEDALRRSSRDPFLWGVYQLLGYCRLHLGQFDQAVDFLVKSRAGNPWNASTHLFLAAALAMNSDLDAGEAALQEALKLDPQANSIEFFRQHSPCRASPECGAAREKDAFRRLATPGLSREVNRMRGCLGSSHPDAARP
jgi:adenylate cyclase